MTTTPEVESDLTLSEAASKLRVSTRWVRNRIKDGDDPESDAPAVEHIRRGNKIMFTVDQLEKLRSLNVRNAAPAVPESITTGPRRKRAS